MQVLVRKSHRNSMFLISPGAPQQQVYQQQQVPVQGQQQQVQYQQVPVQPGQQIHYQVPQQQQQVYQQVPQGELPHYQQMPAAGQNVLHDSSRIHDKEHIKVSCLVWFDSNFDYYNKNYLPRISGTSPRIYDRSRCEQTIGRGASVSLL